MEPMTPIDINMNNSSSPAPIGQPKKPFNAKLVIIIGTAVLVAAGVWASALTFWSPGGQVCWPYCPGMTNQDREEIKKGAFNAEIANWQTYRSEKYGFEVKIPNTWPKFNVRERSVDEAAVADGVKLLEFGFLTSSTKWPTESGFAYIWGLQILTPDQYSRYSDPRDGSKPEIFKQNENYIFAISHGSGGFPEDLENQKSGIVFSTFKFTPLEN